MIKELHLKNWKSFDSSTLYIDPLSILIGTNASGKSNVLDAFMFLSRLAWGSSISYAINGDQVLSPIRGGSDWIVRKGTNECTLEVVGESDDEAIDYKYTLRFQKTKDQKIEILYESLYQIERNSEGEQFERGLFFTEIEGSDISKDEAGYEKIVGVNSSFTFLCQMETFKIKEATKKAGLKVLNDLKNVFILDPIPKHMRSYAKLSENLQSDAANIAGVLSALANDEKETIENTLTEYVSKLPEQNIVKIWAEKVGRLSSDAMLYCTEQWTECETIEIDARGMSDGTLRFLAIITAILTVKENTLLIVEEIDNGLHPSRANELVNMLKTLGSKRHVDILCTTHNPALLDAFGNSMIPFISYLSRNKQTGCSAIILLEDINQLNKLMASGTVGELMTSRALERNAERSLGNE